MIGSFILLLFGTTGAASESLGEVRCVTAWGGSSGRGSENVVTADRINDGYCDCVETAADEPNTEACAGLSNWAGLPTVPAAEDREKKTT